jgi:hypothetical protein
MRRLHRGPWPSALRGLALQSPSIPRPGRNLGLGREVARRSRPPRLNSTLLSTVQSHPSRSIERLSFIFGGTKQQPHPFPKTLSSFLLHSSATATTRSRREARRCLAVPGRPRGSPCILGVRPCLDVRVAPPAFYCLFSFSFLPYSSLYTRHRESSSAGPWPAGEGRDEGDTAVGPFAGARVPQRVSAWPSSGPMPVSRVRARECRSSLCLSAVLDQPTVMGTWSR